ncbi:hypothetical protein [Mycobacteroides abscessus]
MNFEQVNYGFIKAKGLDGSDVWFKPLNLVIRNVSGGVELTFSGPYTVTVQGSAEEYLEFLEPSAED